jgi:DNA-directed RNA polymerase specialized sigma24 family protein
MLTIANSLDEVFSSHYEELLDWCRKLVPRALAEPEDVMHSAYLRTRGRFRLERSSAQRPLAYLRRSICFEIADRRRSEARRRRRELRVIACRPPWYEATPLDLVAMREMVVKLKGRPREVCQAILAGMTAREISHQLNLSPGAIAVHLCRARASLKVALN